MQPDIFRRKALERLVLEDKTNMKLLKEQVAEMQRIQNLNSIQGNDYIEAKSSPKLENSRLPKR